MQYNKVTFRLKIDNYTYSFLSLSSCAFSQGPASKHTDINPVGLWTKYVTYMYASLQTMVDHQKNLC